MSPTRCQNLIKIRLLNLISLSSSPSFASCAVTSRLLVWRDDSQPFETLRKIGEKKVKVLISGWNRRDAREAGGRLPSSLWMSVHTVTVCPVLLFVYLTIDHFFFLLLFLFFPFSLFYLPIKPQKNFIPLTRWPRRYVAYYCNSLRCLFGSSQKYFFFCLLLDSTFGISKGTSDVSTIILFLDIYNIFNDNIYLLSYQRFV